MEGAGLFDGFELFVGLLFALKAMLFQSPVYIAYLIGVWIAIRRWRRHPRISRHLCVGLGILLGTSVILTFLEIVLPGIFYGTGLLDFEHIQIFYTGVSVL